MKSNKRFYIIMTIIIILLILLLVYYFSGKSQNISITGGNNTNNTSDNKVIVENKSNDKTVETFDKVLDYNSFYSIQEVINNYYSYIIDKDASILLNVIDKDYQQNNNINKKTVINKFSTEYEEIVYYLQDLYKKTINNTDYYFANGNVSLYDFASEEILYNKNVSYMIIVDRINYTYNISPINNGDNIFDYAKDFLAVEYSIKSNKDNYFNIKTFDDEYIANQYLNYYQNLLYLDIEEAYNILDQDTKNTYSSIELFNSELETIYNKLSSQLHGYSIKESNNTRLISVILMNQTKITINVSSIMDFTIKLNFNY